MHNGLTWAAAIAMLPSTLLFAWAVYRVWRDKIVVYNRNGSVKSPLRYALWTSFCGGIATLLFWSALTNR